MTGPGRFASGRQRLPWFGRSGPDPTWGLDLRAFRVTGIRQGPANHWWQALIGLPRPDYRRSG